MQSDDTKAADSTRQDLLHMIAAAREQVGKPNSSTGVAGRTAASPSASGTTWVGLLAGALPDYELSGEISRGGQGMVYLATQKRTNRPVAIKVMREGPLADARDRVRFEREIQILGALNHPNIVGVYDSGVVTGSSYLVMEYVPGKVLDEAISDFGFGILDCQRSDEATKRQSDEARQTGSQNPRSKIDAVLRLFAKICDAVNAAHLRGIIHRDLKPSNIRVDPSGEPHVLDFGLAKISEFDVLADSSAPTMTQTGQFVGSLPWASPEQVEGRPERIDTRTDVYALGVMLFDALTGEFPYPVRGNLREVANNIVTRVPARPRLLRREIGDEVETIVLKCLAKEPERRYQTAGELGRDLQRYLAGELIEAKHDSGWYVLKKTLKRHRMAVSLLAVFVLLVSGSALALSIMYRNQTLALAREETQRNLAQTREQETQQVAEFQSKMLTDINVERMGAWLREDLLAEVRRALERGGDSEAEIAERLSGLQERLAGVNFTNAAVRSLDRNVLQQALRTVERELGDQPAVQASLLQTVSDALRTLGLYDAALPPQEQALATRRRVLGDEHPDTLESINNMGYLLQMRGQLPQAEPYYREALEQRRRVLGDEHPDTLISISNMGYLRQAQNRLLEAEALYRDALEKRRRVLGDEHQDTMVSINNIGFVLHAQGKFVEAEEYFREALEQRRRVLGEDHPDTIGSINNMGFVLQPQGKLNEAEPYYREALDKCRRVLGDEHQLTLSAINNVGALLKAQRRLNEAEPYYREALEKCGRVLGDEHPDTLMSMNNMGALLQDQGRLDEAKLYYSEALEKRRRVLGDEHTDTLSSLNDMGSLLHAREKLSEAEPYFREALEGYRRALGEEHPHTLGLFSNMGRLLYDQGRFVAAEPYFRAAADGAARSLGQNDWRTGLARARLGRALAGAGRFDEAEAHLLAAEQCLRQAQGVPQRAYAGCLEALHKLFAEWHVATAGNGYDAQAAKWSDELARWRASTQPIVQPAFMEIDAQQRHQP